MRDVTRPTLTQFIDDAMRLRRTNAVQIERETGLDANWTRQFKAGRVKTRPDPDRVHTLAGALGVDEAELWQYLGRFDRVAQLRAQPAEPAPSTDGDVAAAIDRQTEAIKAQTAILAQLIERLPAPLEFAADEIETLRAMARTVPRHPASRQGTPTG